MANYKIRSQNSERGACLVQFSVPTCSIVDNDWLVYLALGKVKGGHQVSCTTECIKLKCVFCI